MKWIEAKVEINTSDVAIILEVVADIFFECGLKGVIMEDGKTDPTVDWGDDAVDIEDTPCVIGFFAETSTVSSQLKMLEKKMGALNERTSHSFKVDYKKIDDEDWAECWKEFFWPVQITENIIIKPTWREYEKKKGDIILKIDPGMAFGTGTHATTALCIQMVQKYLKGSDRFLDIGTGSGILMMAAGRLGASMLIGTDMDEMATRIARQNLLLNDIPSDKFMLVNTSLVESVGEPFELVVANILSEVIDHLLYDIKKVMISGGIFIASGIITENKSKIVERMKEEGLNIMEIVEKESWVAIVARR